MTILTINAGSSSIKYKVFNVEKNKPYPVLTGIIEGIGERHGKWAHEYHEKKQEAHAFETHEAAFTALATRLIDELTHLSINAVGHRIVHGGREFVKPTLITDQVLARICALSQLAPIHNPINALGVEFARRYFPMATHIALFDSAFHHSLPEFAYKYPIDHAIADTYQIRRYGFHGLNHEYVARTAASYLNKPIDTCHFITLHLGNGASACLIKNGQSVDTSMGFTPLAGLMMGSRCGDIDPAIPLYLQRQGMSLHDVDTLLNKRSGLVGIANENDMRHLLTRMAAGDKSAALAISMYVYSVQKIIGSYISQTPALDGLIFTGGVGENAAFIREKILSNLAHMNLVCDFSLNNQPLKKPCHPISVQGIPILIIRGDEEQWMAEMVLGNC